MGKYDKNNANIYRAHNRNFFTVKTYIYSPTCALVFASDFFK